MSNKHFLSFTELERLAIGAAQHIVENYLGHDRSYTRANPMRLYGVPRGGVPAALAISSALAVPTVLVNNPEQAEIIVDDLIDSGTTAIRHQEMCPGIPFVVLINKLSEGSPYSDSWVVFPWEGNRDIDKSADDIGIRLLQHIGEDPNRGGLHETPARFIKAWGEMTSGYGVDPHSVAKAFEDGADDVDEMVLLRHIPVESQCEHHMIRFWGWAHVAYIPDGKIMGLSKFNRLVDVFGRRLQVQERLTVQIANAIEETLKPLGVGVVLECRHGCMEARGVQSRGTTTVTSALRGVFREQPATRAEFMQLAKSDLPI